MYWICIRTHNRQEKTAMRNLQNQGFDYYFPRILERKRAHPKGFVLVEAPLFPNYGFVRIEDKWLVLHSTIGIASIVTMNKKPAIVQDHVIESLKQREQDGFVVLPEHGNKAKQVREGDTIMIVKGPFALQRALVRRMPARGRQRILLSLLANRITVLVDEKDIE